MALIHLDAGVLIGFLDRDDAHHEGTRAAIQDALDAGDGLAMAASALAECLVGPARRGDDAVDVVLDLVPRLPLAIAPLEVEHATTAARLRAAHPSLRLPDALVIATAAGSGADELITTDRRWPTALQLRLPLRLRVL